jgi:hypothetical protein
MENIKVSTDTGTWSPNACKFSKTRVSSSFYVRKGHRRGNYLVYVLLPLLEQTSLPLHNHFQ